MQLDQVRSTGNAIQSYGAEKFVISGQDHPYALLLTDQFLAPLESAGFEQLSLAALQPLLDQQPKLEMLIIGTGARMQRLPEPLRAALRARAISADAMDTGAACRTYTILQSEGRRVGAVLLLAR